MSKFVILPLILVGCTAPVTHPPAEAFELEIEESQWDFVYNAIEYIKRGEIEKTMTQLIGLPCHRQTVLRRTKRK